MTNAISASGLVKSFGRTRALDGLDLSVNTGEVHGFLGPNGAGKSTTIRILLGLMRADSGEAGLLGGDPLARRHRASSQVGLCARRCVAVAEPDRWRGDRSAGPVARWD